MGKGRRISFGAKDVIKGLTAFLKVTLILLPVIGVIGFMGALMEMMPTEGGESEGTEGEEMEMPDLPFMVIPMPAQELPNPDGTMPLNTSWQVKNNGWLPMKDITLLFGTVYYQGEDMANNITVYPIEGAIVFRFLGAKKSESGTVIRTIQTPPEVIANPNGYNQSIIMKVSYENAFGFSYENAVTVNTINMTMTFSMGGGGEDGGGE